jgi:hypothetical protein
MPSHKENFIFAFIAAGIMVFSCNFPYRPEQFILPEWPESPYKFPGVAAIDSFFNTHNVKIAYTLLENGARIIYYVNFNDAVPTPVKLKKPAGMENIDADSPLISPEGSFVAYYLITGNTMFGAYFQKLDPDAQPICVESNGTEPHWWKDSAGQVYIIYSDHYMVENLTLGIGNTYRQKVSLGGTGTLVGTADTIAPYPMNGGLSKDGRYLCTGYKHAAFYDIFTKTLIPINGDKQVCNPSINPDNSPSDWMMFLNLGGVQTLNNPHGFPVTGTLNDHTFLFIVDAGNAVQDYIPITIMGSGYNAWQCPEWSNNPQFAAAMALPNDLLPTGDGVIIKGIGNQGGQKETLIFTQGNGKLNTQRSTPYVWVGN